MFGTVQVSFTQHEIGYFQLENPDAHIKNTSNLFDFV